MSPSKLPETRAHDRAERENGDRHAEDETRAEAVGDPAADRQEDGEREEIGGNRKMQPHRRLVQRSGDGGQGGREAGRVEVLHKKSAGDDQRNDHIPRQYETSSTPGRSFADSPLIRWRASSEAASMPRREQTMVELRPETNQDPDPSLLHEQALSGPASCRPRRRAAAVPGNKAIRPRQRLRCGTDCGPLTAHGWAETTDRAAMLWAAVPRPDQAGAAAVLDHGCRSASTSARTRSVRRRRAAARAGSAAARTPGRPQGCGSLRDRPAGSALCVAFQNDQRIERHAAFLSQQKRIHIDRIDRVAGIDDEIGKTDERRDERIAVEDGPAAIAIDEPGRPRSPDERAAHAPRRAAARRARHP